MTHEDPRVIIIILNWNNAAVTLDCLHSLEGVCYPNKEILLIDNGSDDDSLKLLEDYQRRSAIKDILTVIPLKENFGFAGGNNKAMEMAVAMNAEYVLLLNNDTIVAPDFLSKLIDSAVRDRHLGVVGAKIHYYPEKQKIWFTRGKIDYLKGAFYHETEDAPGLLETDFVTGCLMLIPLAVLKKVGFFDERFFLNAEDVDLSKRIESAGYKLRVRGDAIIYHKYSTSIGGKYSRRNQYYFHRNRMLFFSKHLNKFRYAMFCLLQSLIAVPLWLCWQGLHGRKDAIKGAISGYLDYACGRLGRCRRF